MSEAPKKHSYRFQVLARGAWGSVTSCDRAGVDHDHDRCVAYLRQQSVHWDATGYFVGLPTRIVDLATESLLK